ncbi:MAG: endonuclease Q family protein [Patescibacteria group bacterium]|nr:endonuclease Q family protein [Patescibacteria group bacterium]
MRVIADLHIHSKFSRACSKDLDLEHNDLWARKKGIDIVGTGDFTHPGWIKELQEKLIEEKPGLYKLKGNHLRQGSGGQAAGKVLFMLTTELSCIYSQGGKVRRIHLCVFVPDFVTVEKINTALENKGVNLKSDGRPIMGLHADELTKIIIDANPESLVIPAHAWTPWFSVFGSNSGFDTLEECFGAMTPYIYAIETGLSSDPPMNWRLSALDQITLISNSDAHSSPNLGREANVFEIAESKLSYREIRRIIKSKDQKSFLSTIEFFPEEGKYHFDGHRACNVRLSPAESKKHKNICPVCKKPLTIGVMNRVEILADRAEGYQNNFIPFKSIVPLPEIMAEVFEVGKGSKKVMAEYENMLKKGGNEFKILLDLPISELEKFALPPVVMAIKNIRGGLVKAVAGYDGVYGVISALGSDRRCQSHQPTLL